MSLIVHIPRDAHPPLQTPGSLSRLSFIHTPSSQSSSTPATSGATSGAPSSILARLIAADALSSLTPNRLLSLLGLNDPTEDAAQQPLTDSADSILANLPERADAYEKYADACRLVARQLGLKPGEHAIIVNGRVRSSPFSLMYQPC